MTHFIPTSTKQPRMSVRAVWFWLLVLTTPFVLFLAVLGVLATIEKWQVFERVPPENPQMQESGLAPWLPKERRAYMEHRIDVIDGSIPAIKGEIRFLEGALKREQAQIHSNAEAKEYAKVICREQRFLEARIDELRTDREYYVHELREK